MTDEARRRGRSDASTLVLGVRGDGSKTEAVVADTRGNVLAVAASGPSNWEDVGLEDSRQALTEAVTEALSVAGIGLQDIRGSVFGLAGVDWDSDVERLMSVIEPLGLAGPKSIVNDAFLPLRAGTQWPWGIAVVAGAGSVAVGRTPAGELFRTSGLGPIFGDRGSASEVVADAVRAVADAYTGRGTPTSLTERLSECTGSRTVPEFLESMSREVYRTPASYALFVTVTAPVVLKAAEAGDFVAQAITIRAGTALGESGAFVARRLSMEDLEFELVLAGELFSEKSRILIDPLEALVKEVAPGITLVHLDAPEVVGAVLMAMELATNETYGGVRQRLSSGIAKELRAARRANSG